MEIITAMDKTPSSSKALKTPHCGGYSRASGAFIDILFLLLLSHSVVFSQDRLSFDNITPREGLSNPSVFTICQDVTGAMWFGGDEGAERYDGYGFRSFKVGMVFKICADERGYVWIGAPSRGLFCYDIANDTLISIAETVNDPARELHTHISTLTLDSDGILWIGLTDGLARFDTKQRKYLSDLEPSVPSESIQSIADDHAGNMWLGACCGIVKFEKKTCRATVFDYDLSATARVNIAFGHDGKLWANGGHVAGLVCFDTSRHTWSGLNPPGRTLDASNVLVGDDGRVWLTTATTGLSIYSPRTQSWEEYRHHSSDPHSLASDRIGVIYRDNVGNIWFGTRNGISKLAHWRKQFWSIPHETDNPNSPPNPPIRSISEDSDGNLWIASYGDGLRMWNRRTNTFTPIKGISQYVNAVVAARSGWIWIGTQNPDAVTAIDPSTKRKKVFTFSRKDSLTIPYGPVYSLFEDVDGSIWVGNIAFGIGRIDPSTGKCRRTKPLVRAWPVIRGFYRDEAGKLWAPVDDMLVEIFGKADSSRGLLIQGHLSPWERTVNAICEDQKGRFWIGTHGGFGLLDRSTGNLTYIRHDTTMMQVSAAYGILEDGKHDLWLLNPKGVSRFHPDTKEFTDFEYGNGFPYTNLAINWNYGTTSYCRTRDGYLVFGTGEGIVLFHPDSIHTNPNPPNVIITNIKVGGIPRRLHMSKLTAPKSFEFSPLELPYDQNDITFEFAALDYTAPLQNSYSHELEGFEDTWSPKNNIRIVDYVNLTPGNYVFRVKAANNDGVWNEQGASMKITIVPPWWMTWWFRASIALCVIGVIVLIIELRVRSAVAEERLRTNIARNLHDDLSGTLSSITFYSEAVKRSEGEQLRHYVGQISESAREAKEKISDIIWSVDPHHDDSEDFLARCVRYASDILDSKRILHEMKVDKSLPSALAQDLRQNLWLIFKEIIVNLVRHSCCSRATISITRMKNSLVIDIADNGKGFDVGASHHGNGLNNIRSRSEAIGATVALDTARGRGTQWRIEVRL